MSDYEPPAEMVEALAKDMRNNAGVTVTDYARFVLRRQHERELALREATRMAVVRAFETDTENGWSDAMVKFRMDAYDAAHAKLDAPKDDPIVNLRGAVDQIERECPGRVIATLKDSQAWQVIQIAARGKAAVEREEANKR